MHEANASAGASVYSDLGSDVLFDVKIVVTDRFNRKGGLGTDLLRRSVDLARVLDFKGCKTEATGELPQKMKRKNHQSSAGKMV